MGILIQIQPMLRLNLISSVNLPVSNDIQIQPMLRLNLLKYANSLITIQHSNTTNVKVKLGMALVARSTAILFKYNQC